MISGFSHWSGLAHRRLAVIAAVALVNTLGVLYYAYFVIQNGYLPSPFIFDKTDTFMDLFNTMYWASNDGRYTEWQAAYPPLAFLILRFAHFALSGSAPVDPFAMRDASPLVILGLCFAYFLLPAVLLGVRYFQTFSKMEKVLLYVALVSSTPMLFALERGNLILLCPIVLAIAISRIGMTRALSIALLINLKPYFALLLLYYAVRRNWGGLVHCTLLSGLVFVITGLVLDDHFFLLLSNLLSFSQRDALFSPREVLSLPSSISAYTYVLRHPLGAEFVSRFLSANTIDLAALLIDAAKWGIVGFAFAVLNERSSAMRDAEVLAVIVVLISNVGVSVGGYSFIFYGALVPIFLNMRARPLYLIALVLIATPLDMVSLRGDFLGVQYPFLSDFRTDVYWTLGLGSVLRPLVNLVLLALLSFEFLKRQVKTPMGLLPSLCGERSKWLSA